MFALCTGFEQLLSGIDAVVDSLVVAGLEMQCVIMSVAAPVAAVKRRIAFEEDSGRDRRAAFFGQDDENIVGQLRTQALEECLVEVRERAAQHERARDQGVNG